MFHSHRPRRGRGRGRCWGQDHSKLYTQSKWSRGYLQSLSLSTPSEVSPISLSPVDRPYVRWVFPVKFSQVQNPLFQQHPDIKSNFVNTDETPLNTIHLQTKPLHTEHIPIPKIEDQN